MFILCWLERFKWTTSLGCNHHNLHREGSMKERRWWNPQIENRYILPRRITYDRLKRIRLGLFVIVTGFFHLQNVFFSYAKTLYPKHEDLSVMNTSVVNLTRIFLFRLIVKFKSEVTYGRFYLFYHNVKPESPYSKSGKPCKYDFTNFISINLIY